MIGKTLGRIAVCGSLLMAGATLQAHHSLAGVYDMSAEKEIQGTLTKIQFVNPHGSMTITVKNPDGTTIDWTFTTGSATTLADRGIPQGGPDERRDVHDRLGDDPRRSRDQQSRPERAEDRRTVDREVHSGAEWEATR